MSTKKPEALKPTPSVTTSNTAAPPDVCPVCGNPWPVNGQCPVDGFVRPPSTTATEAVIKARAEETRFGPPGQ